MSQHLLAIHVANGIDSLDGRLKVLVHRHALTLVVLDASLSEISLHTRLTTCGHQDDVGIDISHVLYSRLHLEGDATLLQQLTQPFGYIAIERRQTLLEILNHRHLGAKAVEHRGKLHADDARADYGQPCGLHVEVQQSCRVHHTLIVEPPDGKPLGFGACGNDDGNLPLRLHEEGSLSKDSLLTDEGDVRVRQYALYTLTQLSRHQCHAFASLGKRRTVNIRLGGYAAHVQTSTANFSVFEDNHPQALLCSIFCSTVAARPRTDDNQVCIHHTSRIICRYVVTGCLAARTSSTRPMGVS